MRRSPSARCRTLRESCAEVLAVGKADDALALPFPVSTTARTSGRRSSASSPGCAPRPTRRVRRPAGRLPARDARSCCASSSARARCPDRPSSGRVHEGDAPASSRRASPRGELSLRGVNATSLEVDERLLAQREHADRPRRRDEPRRSTTDSAIARSLRRTTTPCSDLATDFWATALWAARRLRKGEVFVAVDALNGAMKRSVVTLLGWHALSVDPEAPVCEAGRGLERWADAGALSALERAYAHYDLRDAARALWETIDLFHGLEEETGRRLGLAVDLDHAELQAPHRGRRPRPAPWIYAVAVKRALLLAVAAALLLAGCGDDSSGETTTTAADTTSVRVYFLRDGKVWPVSREIERRGGSNDCLTAELAKGPTEQEKQELGLTTEIPSDPDAKYTTAALAQLVYTLTQFPTVEVGRDRGEALHTRRLRGPDADHPRRVPASVRAGLEPAPGHGHGEHVRGDLPVRARRQRGECRGQELRHGDVRDRDARDVRLHHRRLLRCRRSSSSSRTPPRTVRGSTRSRFR